MQPGKRTLWRGVVGLIATFGLPLGMATAQTKIVFNQFAPPKFVINTDIINPWIADIEKATEGRVKFEVPPSSLAPPPEQFNIVAKGVADGAYLFNTFLRQSVRSVQVGLLPLVNASGEADSVALWRTYEKFFKDKNEYADVVLVGFFGAPTGTIATSKDKPITTVAQLRGMKMWSLPGVPAQAVTALGAVVVPGPAVRAYEIISKGTVDGYATMGHASALQFNVAQYSKSMTELEGGVFSAQFSVFFNKAKWAEIGEKDRAAILALSGESLARRSRRWDDLEAKVRAEYIASGKQVVQAPPAMMAEVRKAWAKFQDEWIAEIDKMGVSGKAALEFFNAEVRKVAAEKK
jgi:TRAP-type C4-dicarboxylate transport system substrate-binding protein